MASLTILGSAPAVADARQDNTHMLLVGEERMVLIDTSTNPILRLRQAGFDPTKLTDLFLTHFHPDHVSGVPILLLDLWLLGRKQPLNIYGLADTLDRTEKMMDLFGWLYWPNLFPVNLIRLADEEMHLALQTTEFSILTSPVRHMIPNIGLRVNFNQSGRSMAYSCDTEPCPEVVRLATDVDLLIHEATGAEHGHSSAAQAGEIARKARARKLMLIHYDSKSAETGQLIEQAHAIFQGPVELAQDFLTIEWVITSPQ
jgi:ribonuclease Z